MEAKLSKAARRLEPSPIQELSHLAQRVGAVNLAEVFPDFPAPSPVKAAAVAAIDADLNQYSVTGWRIGWAIAPSRIAFAIRNVHIKLVDSAPAPFQEAALTALGSPPEYFESLKAEYEERRNFVIQILAEIGFEINFKPHGSVFIFAELPKNWLFSDIDFVRQLIQKAGVAAVPGGGFFHPGSEDQTHHKRYVRFAFCKNRATLCAAAEKIRSFVKGDGQLSSN